jgi:hypothetical protein
MEFLEKKEKAKKIMGYGMLGSKGQYQWENPTHCVIFNANVCIAAGKIWHGDLDLVKSSKNLMSLANELEETVYVLYESDGRFEFEEKPRLNKAPFCFEPGNSVTISKDHVRFMEIKDEAIFLKPTPAPTEDEIKAKKDYEMAEAAKYVKDDFEKCAEIDWKYLNTFSKKKNTLEKFWEFIDKKYTEEQKCSNFFVTQQDCDKIKELLTKWVKRCGASDYRAQSDASWFLLAYGPETFIGGPEWVEFGQVYRKINKP